MSAAAPVLVTREVAYEEGLVAFSTVHAHGTLNLVDRAILERACTEFQALAARTDLRCIVLTGVTAKAFIGGANLHALGSLDAASADGFIRSIHAFCTAIRRAPQPVVAALRGHCIGAGLEIAAACDLRLAALDAHFGMPEVRVGVPSVVEAALLPGLIGWGRARELMLRGQLVDAVEAERIGLVQRVAPAAELDSLVDTVLRDLLAGAPGALAAQKRLFLDWEESHQQAAIEHGVRAFVAAYADGDEPARYAERFFKRRRE